MNESGMIEEKPSYYKKVPQMIRGKIQTNEGIMWLIYDGKGESDLQIIKPSMEEIVVPMNGYPFYEDFNDGYRPAYIDFINNRIITSYEKTASGMTEASIQLFDLIAGEPMWDQEGKRLTVSINDLRTHEFHVDENGTLTVAGFDYYGGILKVIQFDKNFNQIFYEETPLDLKGEESPIIRFSKDGTINIYDFPLFKEKVHLNLIQMKVGILEE